LVEEVNRDMGILLRDLLEARVGIELKRMMKRRKLIPLKSKNTKNTVFAQVQYRPGTQVHKFSGSGTNLPILRLITLNYNLIVRVPGVPLLARAEFGEGVGQSTGKCPKRTRPPAQQAV